MTIDIRLYSSKDMEPEIAILGEFRLRYFREYPFCTPERAKTNVGIWPGI